MRTERLPPAAVEHVLAEQHRHGGRFGWIAHHLGYLSRFEFLRALAVYYGVPFWDTMTDERLAGVDATLWQSVTVSDLLAYETIPVRWWAPGVLECWTLNPVSTPVMAWLQAHWQPTAYAWVVLSEQAWQTVVHRFWGSLLTEEAVDRLAVTQSAFSAERVITPKQGVAGMLGVGLYGSAWIVSPHVALLGTVLGLWAGFAGFWAMKLLWGLATWVSGHDRTLGVSDPLDSSGDAWPVYTVLVPLYHEPPAVVHALIQSLAALDYPANKLDVLFLVEADDTETIDAVKAARPPWHIRIIRIADSLPRPKPKACNYGLQYARGQFLVIYDAEDRPDPAQLQVAVRAFRAASGSVVLQAALNFYNATQNVLTRAFALEYALWFDALLPGLTRFGWPIPLGGTSNHFETATLRRLQGWDPYNVTEDADLGLRAAALGVRAQALASTTWEEATSRLGNWIWQRSRWIKGYMQTTLVYTRRPVDVARQMGWGAYGGVMTLVAGTPWVLLTAPVAWVLGMLVWMDPAAVGSVRDPSLRVALLGLLIVGYGTLIVAHGIAGWRRGYRWALWIALILPIYWALASAAAWLALYELMTRPSYWYRTRHGDAENASSSPAPPLSLTVR
ncbi:glycosyl transferase family 2 [Sulfobacillus acidophilus TPY]|nr:glycosyl transferase family 2 [Sulfobacillus acidophilus TPY]